jgi:hypothetical protein
MKLITVVLFSMFFTGCTSDKMFKFNQKVKIISGFYEGCSGTIRAYSVTMYGITPYAYYIGVDSSCPITTVEATSDQLEELK